MKPFVTLMLVAGVLVTLSLFSAEAYIKRTCLHDGGALINGVCQLPEFSR